MEVAGLVVAILPLLKRALYKYNECYRPLLRSETFSKDVEDFRDLFLMQKSVFELKCMKLLSCCMDGPIAAEMLRSVNHHLWSDNNVEYSIKRLLEDHANSCKAAIDKVYECVEEISTRWQRTWEALDQETQGVEASSSCADLKNKIVARLQRAWSRDSMDQCLQRLKDRNSQFSTLCDSLVDIHPHRAQKDPVKQNHTTQSLDSFPIANRAARQIYKALSKSCGKHPEHHAVVSVEVEQSHTDEDQKTQVRFTLGLSQPLDACAVHQTNLNWLGMELMAFASIPSRSNLRMYRNHMPDPVTCSIGKALGFSEVKQQAERMKPTHVGHVEDNPVPPTQATQRLSLSVPIKDDLCDVIRNREQQSSDNHGYLGLLSTEDESMLSVHVLPQTDQSSGSSSTSLRCLLEDHSHQDLDNRLLLIDRLYLAKHLAIAILQFHSTPWLKSSWDSGDVYLVESQRGQHPFSKPPHLQTSIPTKESGQDICETEAVDTKETSEKILLSLSIVLLELAHYATFKNLQTKISPVQLAFSQGNSRTVVREFSRSHHTDMGVTYHKIIEALVGSHGLGDVDFSDPQSQAVFYEHVICRLDRLERSLKRFHAEG